MADARSVDVERLFDEIAPIYDPMNRIVSLGLYGRWQTALSRMAAVRPGELVLDVATGTGDLAIRFARETGPAGRVTGVDISQEMLRRGEEKVRRQGLGDRITLLEGNALELPFPDDSFDLATCGFGLRNMPDVGRALREMRRVTRPGGRVLSLDVSHPTLPIYREVFGFFFTHVVPLLGAMGGRGRTPYAWLPKSLRLFPDRRALEGIFEGAGLVRVSSRALSLGAVAIHQGFVPCPERDS